MSEVTLKVETSGVENIVVKLNNYSGNARKELKTAMAVIVTRIVSFIKESELSGQVLRRRTGTLSRSIKGEVFDNATDITGDVRSRDKGNKPVEYAARHEYGFTGQERVKAHVRRLASGGEASVREFVRNVNYGARPFMKPARDKFEKFAQQTLETAIVKANNK